MHYDSIAPGRVNLIGEHIDYNDLSVMPMAVDREVRMTFQVSADATVRVGSAGAEFEAAEFRLDRPIVASAQGHWSNYVRAAALGLLNAGYVLERGMDANVRSTIPIACGMSSSSALVVAAAQALLHANDLKCPPLALASLMAAAEQFVGVAGGGMDQAASLNGRAGHALRVDFNPLKCEALPIPKGWRFCAASSLIRAEKSSRLKDAYNQRTLDCSAALQQVWSKGRVGRTLAEANYLELLNAGPGTEPSAWTEKLLQMAKVNLIPRVASRFRHVVGEAQRVKQAESALHAGDAEAFGQLMLASHESLRVDYEVSLPELDELVDLAMANGAHGARLTGAGFGGCVVMLCSDETLGSLLSALGAAYFAPRGVHGLALDQVLFEVIPSEGARVVAQDPFPDIET